MLSYFFSFEKSLLVRETSFLFDLFTMHPTATKHTQIYCSLPEFFGKLIRSCGTGLPPVHTSIQATLSDFRSGRIWLTTKRLYDSATHDSVSSKVRWILTTENPGRRQLLP